MDTIIIYYTTLPLIIFIIIYGLIYIYIDSLYWDSSPKEMEGSVGPLVYQSL